jgi:hypothetical protein
MNHCRVRDIAAITSGGDLFQHAAKQKTGWWRAGVQSRITGSTVACAKRDESWRCNAQRRGGMNRDRRAIAACRSIGLDVSEETGLLR